MIYTKYERADRNLDCKDIVFTGHAVQRMFERSIQKSDAFIVIKSGEIIAEYPNELPFPCCLMLGFPGKRALHLVLAVDHENRKCYVVTVYPPDPDLWQHDFKIRKPI